MVSPITTCYRNVFFLLSKPQSADFSQSNSDRFRKFAGFFFSFKLPSMLIPTKINSVDCIFLKSNHVLFPFFSDFKVCKSFSQSRNPGHASLPTLAYCITLIYASACFEKSTVNSVSYHNSTSIYMI